MHSAKSQSDKAHSSRDSHLFFIYMYIYMHISYMCVHAFLLIHLYSSSSMPLFLLFFIRFFYIHWRRNNICVW